MDNELKTDLVTKAVMVVFVLGVVILPLAWVLWPVGVGDTAEITETIPAAILVQSHFNDQTASLELVPTGNTCKLVKERPLVVRAFRDKGQVVISINIIGLQKYEEAECRPGSYVLVPTQKLARHNFF